MIDKLPSFSTAAGIVAIVIVAVAGMLNLLSLGLLAASIYPQRFSYVAGEPALLAYAWELIHEEQAAANMDQVAPLSALVTLKTELAEQYAGGADRNRQINKKRERLRSLAGLAALASVAMTVFLVATAYAHYLSADDHDTKGIDNVLPRSAAGQPAQHSRPDPVGPSIKPASAVSTAHAVCDKGLVGTPRGAVEAGQTGSARP